VAISVNWPTGVISVPKADMTLVQSAPTEIYELQLDGFRLTLKNLEDDFEGMPWTKTHSHNTEVTLGGLTFARVIEILAPYTVTFEDGQYAVNLVGANSNVGDVVNVNQVSVRSQNSAGLISNPAIEFASFEGFVTIDVLSSYSGTSYPVGTRRQPVNNLSDAKLIASFRGLDAMNVIGDITITATQSIDGFTMIGDGPGRTIMTVDAGASTSDTSFADCELEGTLLDPKSFNNVHFHTLTIDSAGGAGQSVSTRCGFEDTITLTSAVNGEYVFLDCFSLISGLSTPVFDFAGANVNVSARRYTGGMEIRNYSHVAGPVTSVDMTSGNIIIANTCTTGTVVVRGISKLADSSNGTIVDTSGLVFAEQLQLASFNNIVHLDPVGGSAGIKFPIGTAQYPAKTLADAQSIAMTWGITSLHVLGTLVLLPTDNVDGYNLVGDHALTTIVVVLSGCSTEATRFTDLILTGTVSGGIYGEKVGLLNVLGIGSDAGPSLFLECTLLEGTCALRNGLSAPQNVQFANCTTGVSTGAGTTFDFNGGSSNVAFRKYGGDLIISGDTAGLTREMNVDQGGVTVTASCTAGTLVIYGVGEVTDNSTGTMVVEDHMLSRESVGGAVWDELAADHVIVNSFGERIAILLGKINALFGI